MLVVVEDGDIQGLAQGFLHHEGGRCGDVLQVDATERRRDTNDRVDDLLRVRHVEAHRERVHSGELLEQEGFALHDRHGGRRADIAQTEDSCSVGDYRNCVFLDGQVVGPGRILVDGHADPGHARRVGHRQVVAVVDLGEGNHLDLAALVHVEGPVEPAQDLHAFLPLHVGHHPRCVVLVPTVDDDVIDQVVPAHVETAHGNDVGASFADRRGQPAQSVGHVVQRHLHVDGVGRGRKEGHRPSLRVALSATSIGLSDETGSVWRRRHRGVRAPRTENPGQAR